MAPAISSPEASVNISSIVFLLGFGFRLKEV
jgi:hypothetical protein